MATETYGTSFETKINKIQTQSACVTIFDKHGVIYMVWISDGQ